jgi:2-dehydro-3-deoxyphosphogluconate aldolase/(4S)-4-hydroxy-2-oxoglutarate aldolase
MTKIEILNQISSRHKIIPVVKMNDVDKTIDVIHALNEGGINIIEVTLRTQNALTIINRISQNCPNTLIGAGTVLNEFQFESAINNGAKFIISPGITPSLIKSANKYHNVAFIPGTISPSEIMFALEHELNYLKFFPAEANNGLSNLKNFFSVFPQVKFCPTGGINLQNCYNYLQLPNVMSIGTSTIITDEYLQTNNFSQIAKLAKEFCLLCKTIKL